MEIESPKIYVSNCKVQEGNVVWLPCRNSSEILDFLELASASLCEWTELELTVSTNDTTNTFNSNFTFTDTFRAHQ